jgi:hypothetical protein
MFVPSYQMHNILNVYTKKLRQKINTKDQNTTEKPPADRAKLTAERKRRATIEKVSKEIYEKIIRFGSQADSSQPKSEQIKGKVNREVASAKTNKTGFVFNVIDTIDKKTTNTVSVEDSSFLIQRLEQLSKDTMEINKRNAGFEDSGEIDNPTP